MPDYREMALDFLLNYVKTVPDEHQSYFLKFEEYFDQHLYFELTTTLLAYFNLPDSRPYRVAVFNQFVKRVKSSILQRNYVQLSVHAKAALDDAQERLRFSLSITEEINESKYVEASLFANVSVAQSQLQNNLLVEARETLDKCQKLLDSLEEVENIVRAYFFKTDATYYQQKLEYTNYYRTSFLYLACVDLASIDPKEKTERARKLITSALLSDTTYNFGELILHPILKSLEENRDDTNLRNLLFAINKGDVAQFNGLVSQMRTFGGLQLESHRAQLKEKVALTSLMETVLRQPPHARAMRFEDIAASCGEEVNQVEHLIMKALSLGLIKGTIDQVDQLARINWVHPRVMTNEQIEGMCERLDVWANHVSQMSQWVEAKGQAVWVE